jgi:hypothetical protein
MNNVKYFVFPAGKQEEKFEVLPHTAGDNTFSFAKADLAGTEAWGSPEMLFTWENALEDGAFVNNDVEQLDVTGEYDIVKEEAVEESEA